jgi:hypothetical protein
MSAGAAFGVCIAFGLAAMLFWAPNSALAQNGEASPSRDAWRYQGVGDLSFIVGVPMNEFGDNVDGLGYGASLYAGLGSTDSPLQVGVDVAFLVYGRSTDRVPFSSTVGPRVLVDVVTTNSIVQPHLVLRVQPPSGSVRPYLEGLIGFKYLFTETSVEDDDQNTRIASTTNFDDFAWSGGAGVGLDLRIGSTKTETGHPATFYVTFGVQYLLGEQAEYLAEADLVDANDDGRLTEDELPIRSSRTDIIVPSIGFSVRI